MSNSVVIGAITNVVIADCGGGLSAAVLRLPWEMRCVSTDGTPPDAVVSLRHLIPVAMITGTTAVTNVGGATYTTGLVESDRTPMTTSGSGCSASAYISGTFGFAPTQTIVRL